MVSPASLFSCAAVDVTIDRISQLVLQNLPESLTLEYKEMFSGSAVKSIAAMANTYGGIILFGVADEAKPERLIGVGEAAIVQIVNACHDSLEPPWIPEMIPVRIREGEDSFIIVVRVDASTAPRPILINNAAPVRLHGRNALADRNRLSQLFSEEISGPIYSRRRIDPPHLPQNSFGDPDADFVIRSGFWVPISETANWRPISETSVLELVRILNDSPLHMMLRQWIRELRLSGFNPFHQRGLNRSRRVQLAWQSMMDVPGLHPVESVVQLQMPSEYGANLSSMSVTVDVIVRIRNVLLTLETPSSVPPWQLEVRQLYSTLDGLIAGLTDKEVIGGIADIAGIDSVLVPQPMNAFFRSGPAINELMGNTFLHPIEDAGVSHGADLVTDPTLDLRDVPERVLQVTSWMHQIGQDAGLRGMNTALDHLNGVR